MISMLVYVYVFKVQNEMAKKEFGSEGTWNMQEHKKICYDDET